jgi:dipeptide transport system ATP-binding protein
MALVLITHNMGVVSEMAQRIAVMYAGQLMELSRADRIFHTPRHPYTEALLAAMPERGDGNTRLTTIAGMVPGIMDRPQGCLFAPRCKFADASACGVRPKLEGEADSAVRCHFPLVHAKSPPITVIAA